MTAAHRELSRHDEQSGANVQSGAAEQASSISQGRFGKGRIDLPAAFKTPPNTGLKAFNNG
ncbi:hypothetical protein SAMCFNEI73_pC1544 (plasmid) [Sinorhizobium americanum]|uniref:Uncharacterized protein n=1 Tax=Sinorhizobium americanum TaxID=194963 RepID=A0A1L3LYU3_9HYPH|nr:hypothetical protein SAMCFNEI73_pC1544 [Sinorhizobium americanum]